MFGRLHRCGPDKMIVVVGVYVRWSQTPDSRSGIKDSSNSCCLGSNSGPHTCLGSTGSGAILQYSIYYDSLWYCKISVVILLLYILDYISKCANLLLYDHSAVSVGKLTLCASMAANVDVLELRFKDHLFYPVHSCLLK